MYVNVDFWYKLINNIYLNLWLGYANGIFNVMMSIINKLTVDCPNCCWFAAGNDLSKSGLTSLQINCPSQHNMCLVDQYQHKTQAHVNLSEVNSNFSLLFPILTAQKIRKLFSNEETEGFPDHLNMVKLKGKQIIFTLTKIVLTILYKGKEMLLIKLIQKSITSVLCWAF